MEVVVSFDDLVSRLSIEPSQQAAKGQQSAGRKLKTHKPSAYVPNFPLDILQAVVDAGIEKALPLILAICSIPDVCIDERRLPLFIARATLRGLIAVLEARATGDAAR